MLSEEKGPCTMESMYAKMRIVLFLSTMFNFMRYNTTCSISLKLEYGGMERGCRSIFTTYYRCKIETYVEGHELESEHGLLLIDSP